MRSVPEEMPSLAELTQVVRDRSDVVVIAVSIDDGPEDVNPTLKTVLAVRRRSRCSSTRRPRS